MDFCAPSYKPLQRKESMPIRLLYGGSDGHVVKENELAIHLRATRQTRITRDEVKAVFQQVAVYAGVPAAHSAFAVAKRVLSSFSERDGDSGASRHERESRS